MQGSDLSIDWTELYSGTLAPVGGELEAIEEGLAEIGIVPTVFEPAKMSAQNITYYTPFVSSDVLLIAELLDELQVSWDIMQNNWQANGLEYIGGAIGVDDYLLMTTFPVTSVDDLKGRKIAAPGPAVNWLKGTGAVGVAGILTLYYSDINTGVYDGAIVNDASEQLKRSWAFAKTNVTRQWADSLNDTGQDGARMLTDYMESIRQSGVSPLRDWDTD